MSLVDQIPVVRGDWANHCLYGSHAAWPAACGGLGGALLVPLPLWAACALGALAAVVAAASLGAWKEWRDARINRAALARGLPAPHEASRGDIVATALGAVPVAVPLLVLALLLRLVDWPVVAP